MIAKILKKIFIAFLLSLILLAIGLVVKYLILDSKTALQDILFWIGAFPIAFFSIGVFGDFFGKGDSSYQLSRSVSNQSSSQRGVQDINDLKSGLSWILAGLLIWFYSSFM
jgi:arginine exporter protein ArgO